MTEMEKLKAELKTKWILFDTNVLLKASRNPRAFLPILDCIKDTGCQPVYCQLIRAEFLQSVWQPELIEAMEKFLVDLNIQVIPMRPLGELTDEVMKMTRKLRARKKVLPDLVDSYATVLVNKYKPNLILITENHKHFAYNLERFYVWPLDLNEEEILTIGFYKSK